MKNEKIPTIRSPGRSQRKNLSVEADSISTARNLIDPQDLPNPLFKITIHHSIKFTKKKKEKKKKKSDSSWKLSFTFWQGKDLYALSFRPINERLV